MAVEALVSGIHYLLMAVTVGVVATMLGPNTESWKLAAYDNLRMALAALFGSTHAQPAANLQGQSAPLGLLISFIFAVSSCLLTIGQIVSHLLHYVAPKRQRFVIRILLMVPIYAVDSFWSYLSFRDATWISIARDTYEAYVLYNFYALLMDFLGGEEGCVRAWRQNSATDPRKNVLPHSFPLNHILSPMVLSAKLLWWWKVLLVQYMVLSPLITIASFVGGLEGVFDEDTYALDNTHVYLMVAKTVSVTLAFTALFYLYLATKVTIHDYHPTGKFISIKFVIFFSFWQYIAITTAHSYGLLPSSWLKQVLSWSHGANTVEDQEVALCNILLCVEMFVTAVMHHHVFAVSSVLPHHPHEGSPTASSKPVTPTTAPLAFVDALRHAFSVKDLLRTTASTAKEIADKRTKKQQ